MGEFTDFEPLYKKLDQIIPIPENEKKRILPFLSKRIVKKNDFFVRGGDTTDVVGYMECGLLRYFYLDNSGKEYIRYFCEGGSFVSSFTAVLTGEPSGYFIQALVDTEFIVFKYRDWVSLMSHHPTWGLVGKAIQDYALVMSERRERSFVLEDAAQRYQRFLEEFPGLEAKVKQYDVASYLGITPVALSRIRGLPIKKQK